ncbi:hypothetical protein GDO78_020148 [Eleutherodactylus coqui]|uniref:Uncharacterized protein n=1 Tax=Eleutherodactylus coqui TaxID=57060 RepID=A0A8J6C255_ELECQ|nr:hypothetical protein GDO78_020148 [Eleutherodactylus coqui]
MIRTPQPFLKLPDRRGSIRSYRRGFWHLLINLLLQSKILNSNRRIHLQKSKTSDPSVGIESHDSGSEGGWIYNDPQQIQDHPAPLQPK